jgi:hypothetical protein
MMMPNPRSKEPNEPIEGCPVIDPREESESKIKKKHGQKKKEKTEKR